MSSRAVRALILAVALAVTAGPTACAENLEPAPQVVAAADQVVVTLNVHGGVDRAGGGNNGRTNPVAADVLQLVAAQSPTVLALQELCGAQYRSLRSSLAKRGYSGTFTTARRAKRCGQFGNAIFVKGAIESRQSFGLPWGKNPKGTPGREPRRLVCVKPVGVDWRACSVHLATRNPDRAVQAAKVLSIINRWKVSGVVLGGDLNLAEVYVGRTFPGWSAVGSGIDHVLGSSSAALVGVAVVPSSDHDALIGRAA